MMFSDELTGTTDDTTRDFRVRNIPKDTWEKFCQVVRDRAAAGGQDMSRNTAMLKLIDQAVKRGKIQD